MVPLCGIGSKDLSATLPLWNSVALPLFYLCLSAFICGFIRLPMKRTLTPDQLRGVTERLRCCCPHVEQFAVYSLRDFS